MKRTFLYFLAFVATVTLTNCNSTTSKTETQKATEPEQTEVTAEAVDVAEGTFSVEASCAMCKTRIEEAAMAIDGVEFAEFNLDSKELTVKYDAELTNADEILKAVADAGHDNEKYKADDKTYNALPGCCKYRK